ncbi:hypothetical protein MBLNU230_g6279t1 [Neophaeotheca triangularis]
MANTSGAIRRITKELRHIQEGGDLSLAVACHDSDVRSVRALIIGPPETPYEYGFFEFDFHFPRQYPNKAPTVKCRTTNGGRCRFNPNIYAEGRVCLSILGTWRGEKGEEWSSAQGLESVLLSIQSLMSSNPYENEPGFEDFKIGDPNTDKPKAYVAKIRHETLRISVLQRLEALLHIDLDDTTPKGSKRTFSAYAGAGAEDSDLEYDSLEDGDPSSGMEGDGSPKAPPPPGQNTSMGAVPTSNGAHKSKVSKGAGAAKVASSQIYKSNAQDTYSATEPGFWDPFADLLKRRFLWYYDSYLAAIDAAAKEQPEGTPFARMEFETAPNSMEGSFHYKSIRARFENIRKKLDEESESWVNQGKQQVEKDTQLATQFFFQADQLKYKYDNNATESGLKLDISLKEKKNPFRWHITLFGNTSTNLDGGVFNMSLTIPPTFPEAQPRVHIETPIFHHRVGSTGVLCYFPEKPDEIGSHLEAIGAAFADDSPRYDPRAIVHPEAAALFWGGDEKRKIYNRKLRRSAQDSSEF